MVLSRKMIVNFADFYFDEAVELPAGVDVARYIQTSRPVPGTDPVSFHTILVDLRPDEATLLARCRNNTRYEIIRAAERDALDYECWRIVPSHVLERFCDFFDASAILKGQPGVSRRRLEILASAGALDASVIRDSAENELVWHGHFRSPERARLLETASLYRASGDPEYRKLVGRANRYLHWRDMMRFKSEGTLTYDFGGWTPGAVDGEMLGINRFKEGFGGCIVENFMMQRALTLKGSLALWMLRTVRQTETNLPVSRWLRRLSRLASSPSGGR